MTEEEIDDIPSYWQSWYDDTSMIMFFSLGVSTVSYSLWGCMEIAFTPLFPIPYTF